MIARTTIRGRRPKARASDIDRSQVDQATGWTGVQRHRHQRPANGDLGSESSPA